jgi:hypothetical protein
VLLSRGCLVNGSSREALSQMNYTKTRHVTFLKLSNSSGHSNESHVTGFARRH